MNENDRWECRWKCRCNFGSIKHDDENEGKFRVFLEVSVVENELILSKVISVETYQAKRKGIW
jgi:hypothetical protein